MFEWGGRRGVGYVKALGLDFARRASCAYEQCI